MGKSSSSSKKIKRSKDSSKLRSVKKKKTKRDKSKKIRRLKDYSDDSESSGTDSSLYSSSEDDYRRRKRRSKVSKKRSRKRYSSSESDDARLLKKKKSSKRKDQHVGKKKKNVSRKRRKRDSSSSSTSSSESGSIQDNPSDDSSNSGSESDGKTRIRDRGRLGKPKAAVRRSKDESVEDSEPLEDEVMSQKNSRRLKSIIVVSYAYGNDGGKEDMDDVYLTHGGNSDHGNRELGHNEESDEADGETTISYPTTDDNGRKAGGYDEVGKDISSETSKASHLENSSMKDDDLEAILKKRALENLKRFRGENGIARKEVSSVAGGEPLQIESGKTEESHDHGLMEQKHCVSAGSKDRESSQVVYVKESGTVASPQDQQFGDTAKAKVSSGISSCATKRKLIRPVLRQESLNLASRDEATTACQNAEAESVSGKNCPGTSHALETKNGGENIELKEVSYTLNEQSFSRAGTETLDEIKEGSRTVDETKEGSKSETTDATNDGSQYEQKTMTVMRGGELVQVSYKVYIPKKTSALERRRLKR